MEKITYIYGFHNDSQIRMFLISSSILLSNKNNFNNNLVVFVSKDVEKKYGNLIKKHFEDLKYFKYKIVAINFETGAKWILGKFYWLFAPYLIESDYFIQLDNDILITYDTSGLIKEFKNKSSHVEQFIYYGVWDSILKTNSKWRNSVKDYINNEINFNYKFNNYINTGLVVFDNKIKNEYKRHELVSMINKMITEIYDLYIKSNKNSFKVIESDQNFLFYYFRDNIDSTMEQKYNTIYLGPNLLKGNKVLGFHLHWYPNGRKIDFWSIVSEPSLADSLKNLSCQLTDAKLDLTNEEKYKISKILYKKINKPFKNLIQNINKYDL